MHFTPYQCVPVHIFPMDLANILNGLLVFNGGEMTSYHLIDQLLHGLFVHSKTLHGHVTTWRLIAVT